MTDDAASRLYTSRGFNRRLWDCSLPWNISDSNVKLNLSVHVMFFQNAPAARLSAEDTQRPHSDVSNVSLHKLQLFFWVLFALLKCFWCGVNFVPQTVVKE